jgi:hypothetical protein
MSVEERLIIDDRERGLFRVHRSAMTSVEVLELERERIFDRCWLYVGHESEIEKPGDFKRRSVGGRPIIFIRGADGVARALFDRHFGAKRDELLHGLRDSRAARFARAFHQDRDLHQQEPTNTLSR